MRMPSEDQEAARLREIIRPAVEAAAEMNAKYHPDIPVEMVMTWFDATPWIASKLVAGLTIDIRSDLEFLRSRGSTEDDEPREGPVTID